MMVSSSAISMRMVLFGLSRRKISVSLSHYSIRAVLLLWSLEYAAHAATQGVARPALGGPLPFFPRPKSHSLSNKPPCASRSVQARPHFCESCISGRTAAVDRKKPSKFRTKKSPGFPGLFADDCSPDISDRWRQKHPDQSRNAAAETGTEHVLFGPERSCPEWTPARS